MDAWKDAHPDVPPRDLGPLPDSPAAEIEALRRSIRARGISPDLAPCEASAYQALYLSPLWAAYARHA